MCDGFLQVTKTEDSLRFQALKSCGAEGTNGKKIWAKQTEDKDQQESIQEMSLSSKSQLNWKSKRQKYTGGNA